MMGKKYSMYKVLAHSKKAGSSPTLGKGDTMATFETISLMIAFGMLIAVLSKKDK
ncbi:putative holin-like toxin [Bacillus sp. WMMC1349]|uniref:putative holin-like toxin n=1 Tax=Bacillus sp. WMMC1349 TaxID=2736254 RepID=UPI00281555E3|nr:putative holin-like toxin [Bacillus sp. WMMC1349]